MMIENMLEIPRLFTSIAEALACIVYILPLKKRQSGGEHKLLMLSGPIALVLVHLISGELPITYWIPGMLFAMLTMFLYIYGVCDISAYDAGFLFVRAFILAEFIAAFEWQIYYLAVYEGLSQSWLIALLFVLIIYLPLFILAYWLDARKVFNDRRLSVSFREMMNAFIIGGATFLMNNMNFVIENPFTENTVRANLLYIRTLVDFAGVSILFAFNEQRREMYLSYELNALNDIFHKHYDQYQATKESIDLINRKHHDLKHQIHQIRSEKDPEKREAYLEEIDHAMTVYESRYETGNTVVDTLLTQKGLYCSEHDIQLSCVVNGELLDFMMAMDICSVFGNALDNCIESVMKLEESEKRVIRVAVFSRNDFLMMRFENYYENHIEFQDGLPVTTKDDYKYHGYGIKSIKKTIEAYKGNMTIDVKNDWFTVKILIPLERKRNVSRYKDEV